jgi:hypothetical protein
MGVILVLAWWRSWRRGRRNVSLRQILLLRPLLLLGGLAPGLVLLLLGRRGVEELLVSGG